MHARITRIPNSLISLSLIALFAAALVADQARANLHAEIRASSAFQTTTEEHLDRDVSSYAWCSTNRRAIDADSGPINVAMVAGAADGALADAQSGNRYLTLLPAQRPGQIANEPR